MMSTRVILFALIFFKSAMCYKTTPCDLKDSKCTTKSISLKFKHFVSGSDGVPTSDPICLDAIEGELPSLWYKYTNGSLTGIKNCQVDLIKIIPDELKYEARLICPCLTLESECEVKGEVGSKSVDGKGICKVDLYNYHINLNGDYEHQIDKNGKVHFCLKNNVINMDCKGKAEHDFKNLASNDKQKANTVELTKEDWQTTEEITRQKTMSEYFKYYLVNVNAYLAKYPTDVLYAL